MRVWALAVCIVAVVGWQMAVQVLWTDWNRWFYDALQARNLPGVMASLPVLGLVVGGFVLGGSGLLVARMSLQLGWRRHLTQAMSDLWLRDQRYFRLGLGARACGNPEYRICDDVRLAVEPLVELATGGLGAVLGAVVFLGLLMRIGGSLTFEVAGGQIAVPGYMGIVAFGYDMVLVTAAWRTGRPLSASVALKNEAEALFRAELTRLRENAASVALCRGDAAERLAARARLGAVGAAWVSVIRRTGMSSLGVNANIALSPLVPLLFATPRYFSGALSLGELMQLSGAFTATVAAMVWFVERTPQIADWLASARRVGALAARLSEAAAAHAAIEVVRTREASVRTTELCLRLPDGALLTQGIDLAVAPGERVLITGASGSGKSTLIKAVAGIWPWGSGAIAVPDDGIVTYMPQHAYIPNGTLRAGLEYGTRRCGVADGEHVAVLRRCGLGYLIARLDEVGRWDESLSGGERQRLAFARLLLARPAMIVMDEATSALDPASEASLMSLFAAELAGCTLISVGHRDSLRAWHTREVVLHPPVRGAVA